MHTDKEKAEQDYLKGMKYKDLADKYGVTINTIKSWKQRYKWNRNSVHTKEEGCTQKKRPGAPPGNKIAAGKKAECQIWHFASCRGRILTFAMFLLSVQG
jgi:uncharacterized protein YjcR